MKNLMLKIKENTCAFVIACLGVLARFSAMILATPHLYQHDVTGKYNHVDYALYIFEHWALPNKNIQEFAQPPLNATMQAICMKIFSPFIRYSKYNNAYYNLYSTSKILTFIYSCLTLYIIYKILKEFDLGKLATNIAFAIIALYPGMIVMSMQYSNDALAYLFFYLSLFLSIRWAKNKDLKTMVLLALSIGFGMLTKVSVGLIAFITGPMMLSVLIMEKDKKKVFAQLLIFGLIVFPIGLSYSIRNFVLFKQGFGEIYEVATKSKLNLKKFSWTINDRFLTIPIDRFFDKENGIFHNWHEYNVWIDLIKTSTFDEFHLGEGLAHENITRPLLTIVYILNTLFYIVSCVSIVFTFVDVIKNIFTKTKTYKSLILNLEIISLMLFALAIFAYLFFNIKYPYSCNSNWRYIPYITFAMVGGIVCTYKIIKEKSTSKNS